ncbi:MAG: 1-(5-phosphoribosyl)-5-[(5-phosphoribosylamino)methylideneamino]imidazole-4-carboxamide isomerase [Oscillospiraceae bacterium]|nr:1-(5-phosphoribosyl)-5-[(5-phosphoribosylamino)methylideneamino]imidazole-4-carboxamide isomerase [Oscillospiraceae bacterium]
MIIYPAIDLYEGKVVRLSRGDYNEMTIYSEDPSAMALEFKKAGATHIHIVDLEGARDGKPANFDVIKSIISESGLRAQVGGGIRSKEIVEAYLNIGVNRVILGTAAVSTPGFMAEMINFHGSAIAVSADIKDGYVAINGWLELSDKTILDFCKEIESVGVQTLICTDISKDGLLSGTNIELYKTLRESLSIGIIASGGITDIDEIRVLSELNIDGAILGRAIYTGSIKLDEAIETLAK